MSTSEERISSITRVTFWGLGANAFLGAAKIAGGVLGHSQALIADGLHSFSDMLTDIPIIIGVRFWEKPADTSHPHGHRKIELMVTLFIGIFLTLVAVGIVYSSLKTFAANAYEQPKGAVFFIALASIIIKEFLYRIGMRVGKKLGSSALIANAWHHRSDALSSIPTAIVIAASSLHQNLAFLDVVGALVVSSFILKAAFDIAKPTFDKLTDRGVSSEMIEALSATVCNLKGVCGCHKIRSRYISYTDISIDIHVEVSGDMSVFSGHEIATEVKVSLIKAFTDIVDVVVHIEPCRP